MLGAAQRSEDLFLSLPALSLGQQCLMCAVEIGHRVSVVALLHRDFGGDYRVYSTQPQTIPYLAESCCPDLSRAPYFGSKAWQEEETLQGSS